MVKKIDQTQFDEVKNSAFALVDFSATWCGPCKMLSPIVDELSEELTDVEFFNIDIDESEELTRELGIMAVPSLFLFKSGQKVAEAVGFQPKQNLASWINENK